jgi:hypothetical protein
MPPETEEERSLRRIWKDGYIPFGYEPSEEDLAAREDLTLTSRGGRTLLTRPRPPTHSIGKGLIEELNSVLAEFQSALAGAPSEKP